MSTSESLSTLTWYAAAYPFFHSQGPSGLINELRRLLGTSLEYWSSCEDPSGVTMAILAFKSPVTSISIGIADPRWSHCSEKAALRAAAHHYGTVVRHLPPTYDMVRFSIEARSDADDLKNLSNENYTAFKLANAPIKFEDDGDTLSDPIAPGIYLTISKCTSGQTSIPVSAMLVYRVEYRTDSDYHRVPGSESSILDGDRSVTNFGHDDVGKIFRRLDEIFQENDLRDYRVTIEEGHGYQFDAYNITVYLTAATGEVPREILRTWISDGKYHPMQISHREPTEEDWKNIWMAWKDHTYAFSPWNRNEIVETSKAGYDAIINIKETDDKDCREYEINADFDFSRIPIYHLDFLVRINRQDYPNITKLTIRLASEPKHSDWYTYTASSKNILRIPLEPLRGKVTCKLQGIFVAAIPWIE